jgi:hypothetical protein
MRPKWKSIRMVMVKKKQEIISNGAKRRGKLLKRQVVNKVIKQCKNMYSTPIK